MILTIFTPTYNRQNKLSRLYNSLKCQNCDCFEWLIVDDGSKDHTEELINGFIEEKKIPIKYINQKNSGKHIAYNTALDYADGDYFFCVDSDDWVQHGFINNFVREVEHFAYNGYVAYKIDAAGELLSKKFPEYLEECSFFDLSEIYHCNGEFSLVFRTSVAREFKFPAFENEKFMLESVIYDRMSSKYKFKLLNQIATVCEYQEDGLTANYTSLMKQNPSGFCLYFMQRVDLAHSFIEKVFLAGKYHYFKKISKNKDLRYSGESTMLITLTKPLGTLVAIYYKLVRGF